MRRALDLPGLDRQRKGKTVPQSLSRDQVKPSATGPRFDNTACLREPVAERKTSPPNKSKTSKAPRLDRPVPAASLTKHDRRSRHPLSA